jgi:hypothetical protein
MPTVINNYPEYMTSARAGMRGTMYPAAFISRTLTDVGGMLFGSAVFQDPTNSNKCRNPAVGLTDLLGFADRLEGMALPGSPNGYRQNEDVRIMTRGDIWVLVGANVTKGGIVTVTVADGSISSAAPGAGIIQVRNARFEMDASAGNLALVRID